MKSLKFEQRNLVLHGTWKWLLAEFASYYGVSDEYAKLRYLTYVMDVATPTADCLSLVHDMLLPVVMKSRSNNNLSHQEVRPPSFFSPFLITFRASALGFLFLFL